MSDETCSLTSLLKKKNRISLLSGDATLVPATREGDAEGPPAGVVRRGARDSAAAEPHGRRVSRVRWVRRVRWIFSYANEAFLGAVRRRRIATGTFIVGSSRVRSIWAKCSRWNCIGNTTRIRGTRPLIASSSATKLSMSIPSLSLICRSLRTRVEGNSLRLPMRFEAIPIVFPFRSETGRGRG